MKVLKIITIFFTVLNICTGAFAQKEIDEMSLAEILNMDVSVATKTVLPMDEAPSVVTVITAEQIAVTGAEDLVQVLNTVVGFDMLEDTLPITNIGIRGIVSNEGDAKVKILLDGHCIQLLSGALTYYLDQIPLDNVNRIEIIRGPGSALYGESAFIGVINIITEEAEDSQTISAGYGSYGRMQTTAQFYYRADDFELSVYGAFLDQDKSGTILEKDAAYDLFGPNFSDAPGEIADQKKGAHLRTVVRYKDFYYRNFVQDTVTGTDSGIQFSLEEGSIDVLFYTNELGCNYQVSDNLDVSLKANYDRSSFEQRPILPLYSPLMNSGAEPAPEAKAVLGAKYRRYGGEVSFDYLPHPDIRIVSGVSYSNYQLTGSEWITNVNMTGRPLVLDGVTYQPFQYFGGMRDISDVANSLKLGSDGRIKRQVKSLFLQGTIDLNELLSLDSIGENLSLTAGVRYDDYDDIGSSVNPRAGLIYNPTDRLYFKVLCGEAFRAPNFLDMYAQNNGIWEGNPDIKPETIRTLEGVVGFYPRENITTSLTIFNNKAENLIMRVAGDDSASLMTYENAGSAESLGVEFEVKTVFDENKYAYLNFTFLNSEDTTNKTVSHTDPVTGSTKYYTQDDFRMGYFADFMLNAGIIYGITEDITASLNLNYRGERDRSEEKAFDSEGNLVKIDNRDPVDDVYLLNASLTFRDMIPFLKGAGLPGKRLQPPGRRLQASRSHRSDS
ncbi:MAG: TonB-dependent receptor [Desulfobacterales bacterium]|nr:TonB-dependent receptor [Desulfobacterales bacterium]